MAIVSCRECGADVSDSALKCTHCGFQLRKPKRGIFGKLIKFVFIVFNILMAFWLVGGLLSVGDMSTGSGDVEQAGRAIGVTLGVSMILGIWLVGDLILGLFVLLTRPKT